MSFDILRRQDGIKKVGQNRTNRPADAKSENSRKKYTKSRKQFRKAARGNRTRKARPRGKSRDRLNEMADYMQNKMAETGVKLLWGTANLFSNRR